MSDPLTHECGLALIRLLKPVSYFAEKYNTPLYAFNKLFLLMKKQHNRGQDGAGIGCLKMDVPPGEAFMFREREIESKALDSIFTKQFKQYQHLLEKGLFQKTHSDSTDANLVKKHWNFGGEVLLGHLRYGTSGNYDKSCCHPFFRQSSWSSLNLMLAGNFNMTNTHELNQKLLSRGQHPIFNTDTQTILEEICYQLDKAHQNIVKTFSTLALSAEEKLDIFREKMNFTEIIRNAARDWDGGFTIAGMAGQGNVFVFRDPQGIRPGFYFKNDELVAFASERSALMTVFNLSETDILEVKPGFIVSIDAKGTLREERFANPKPITSCSFERIYFSRGNDPEIYKERKAMGSALAPAVLESIDFDLPNAIFSYIPHTAETAYYGLMEAIHEYQMSSIKEKILAAFQNKTLSEGLLQDLFSQNWARPEKIAVKDIKLRTFISEEKNRVQLASHVYDVTYGVIRPQDTLICVDDSIVRGTTLKRSILPILTRLNPKKIIIVSTAPQIRYPDCYGIDMSEIGKFVAFQAALALLQDSHQTHLLHETYELCKEQLQQPQEKRMNPLRRIYDLFSDHEIANKISELVYPHGTSWNGEIKILFQKIEDLHKACSKHSGDWYFTGNYPTPGGVTAANQAYINFYENRTGRSY